MKNYKKLNVKIVCKTQIYLYYYDNAKFVINFNHLLEKTQKKSFLDLLFGVLEENPNQMTNEDIREEVDTFLFEGHDTSSIAMTMTLILLGLHPNIQVIIFLTQVLFYTNKNTYDNIFQE